MLLLEITWKYFKACYPLLRRGNVAITAAMFWLWLCGTSAVLARSETKPDEFPPNPLQIIVPDPLLPQRVGNQPLTPLQRQNLAAALDQLNAQATAKLKAGDRVGAFEIWNRELRLRRTLGSLSEVEALGRVGAIAWSENQSQELQIITQQLQVLRGLTKFQQPVDLELLQSLGQAYQQVRSPQQALDVYQQILYIQRRQQDAAAQKATLETIGQIELSWFDYPSSATTYKQLLGLARTNGDADSEITYLQQLAYIYEQSKQTQQAVAIRQQLATIYLNQQDLSQLPALRLAIASDYQSLGQVAPAFRNYKEAYRSAWSLQQYARAAEALRQLFELYRSHGQINDALQTSQILLQADDRAVNYYGKMNTYDQIGQIYLKRGDYPDAKVAFQNGLELAKQLQYRETYFTQQISQVSQRSK
jgi:tetratricopeptide (TPR) repeat protein